MRQNAKWSVPVAVVAAMLVLTGGKLQEELPEGVTPEMVEQGQEIFTGNGLCATCHGANGEGTPLAPNLSDSDWLNIDGSYDAIVELVNTGVPTPKEHPAPMLPKGGSDITDDQVRAVAAYVWTLSASAE